MVSFFFLFYDGVLLLADVTRQSFVLKLVVPVWKLQTLLSTAVWWGWVAPVTAVCGYTLHSHEVCTYNQSCYPVIHTLFDPPPHLFVRPLDLPARLTRNSCYTAGFPDGHYPTSQPLTLIRKTNMICRLCVFNCSLPPINIKRPGIFISAAPEVTSRTEAIIIRVFRSFPIFAHLWRFFFVFSSLQSFTPRIC